MSSWLRVCLMTVTLLVPSTRLCSPLAGHRAQPWLPVESTTRRRFLWAPPAPLRFPVVLPALQGPSPSSQATAQMQNAPLCTGSREKTALGGSCCCLEMYTGLGQITDYGILSNLSSGWVCSSVRWASKNTNFSRME